MPSSASTGEICTAPGRRSFSRKIWGIWKDCWKAGLLPWSGTLTPIMCLPVRAEAYADARNIPLYTLQHHAAHIFAVLAENGHVAPALGIALDGAGYGRKPKGVRAYGEGN